MHPRNPSFPCNPRFLFAIVLLFSLPAAAQLLELPRDTLIESTKQNPFERFPDGRPKVPDALLERLRELSSEEVWGVLNRTGFRNQFEGNWRIVHPERKMVGRAITAQFMPVRPDVNELINSRAKAANLAPDQNKRVIELIGPGDIVVVDLFGKVEGGTFVGDNLATAISAQSKNAGMVIDGSVRDLDGIFPIAMPSYIRNVHPTPIADVMLTGINVPVRIGHATVMPGDVVFGDREGVTFIPVHLVQKIIEDAENVRLKDEFTKIKIREGKYRIRDTYPLNKELQKEFEEWKKKRQP